MDGKREVFICYAHEDEPLRQSLEKHLRVLQRQGLINVWHDHRISPGANWEQEIDISLNNAHIILLLVSPDFMASDYCYSIEMKRALQRHEQGLARVLPIIVRPVHWQTTPLGKLQALPTDARPVVSSSWYSQDEALYSVAEGTPRTTTLFKQLLNKRTGALLALPQVTPSLPVCNFTQSLSSEGVVYFHNCVDQLSFHKRESACQAI